jgi:MFS family permease
VKKPALFYGYVVAAACFAIQATGIGTHIAFGVFFKPLLADFGWPRAALAGAHSMAFMLMGLLGIFVGRLNDRLGPRVVMTVTALLFGLGLFLMSKINAVWQAYVFYGFILGMGMSSVDVIALSTTARWFERRRGTMTGIVKVGTGAGQMSIPFAASMLIAAYGWRTSFMILALFAVLMLAGAGQLLRRDPSQRGLLPDGDTQTGTKAPGTPERGLALQEAIRTRQFWIICFANLTVVFALMSILLHITPHAMDIGHPAKTAAGILSAIGGASMAGRLSIGFAADRAGNRNCMIFCLSILISAFLWLQVAKPLWMLYLFAAFYGIGHGGFFTLISPLVAEHFGIRSHGVLFGIVAFAGTIGGAMGPILAGRFFDITGSYRGAFWTCTALLLTGLGLLLSLRHRSAS